MKALPFRLPAPEGDGVDLLVVAGEHSGDQHAAEMVAAWRRRRPGARVAALGGPELARAGTQLLHDMTTTSVVGLVEVLKHYAFFKALFDETLRWIEVHRPRAVCLVDYPGFNLRLAAALHARGLSRRGGGAMPVLFYISPQIWAWKARRRFTMARHLDALATIFPFEPACYADTELPVEFVGHPFVSDGHVPPVRHDPAGPILLLPGSRQQAVARIYPMILRGWEAAGRPREAVVLYPSEAVRAVIEGLGLPAGVSLRRTGESLAAAAVLTSSGTMSMHCALAGIPGAVAYRANVLTYLLGRWLVKVPYLGMANLLLKEPFYPEYLQGAATPAALAAELRACLADPERGLAAARGARRLRELLRAPARGDAAEWLERGVFGGRTSGGVACS
jgi:lipid-A-disaccharide synthase